MRRELLRAYLKDRGMRVLDSADKKLRVDVYDSMSEEEIKRRVNEIEIMDLDQTVDDSGEELEEAEGDDKSADESDDGTEDVSGFRFKVIGEEDTNEFRMPNSGN